MKTKDPVARSGRLLLMTALSVVLLGGCNSSSEKPKANAGGDAQSQPGTDQTNPESGTSPDSTEAESGIGSSVGGEPIADANAESEPGANADSTPDSDPGSNPDSDSDPGSNPDSDPGSNPDVNPGSESDADPVQTPENLPNDASVYEGPVNTADAIPPNHRLAALPNPPATPPPGSDSEPVRIEPKTSSITDFFVVRDPIRELSDIEGELTDADYALGPLPPVITTPPEVDPMTNAPPFFLDLKNREIFAGEQVEVLFDPEDPDGGLPGMFGGNMPEGAKFEDNKNGTKSFKWVPLQPDVGIHEFTATAIDPLFPQYRSAQTVRIKVKLPADQSNIRNLPPGINHVRPHTVRVNDPVVVYLKVTDPNGTIPELQVLNLPAGATLTPHPSEELMTILHFVPDAAGKMVINLKATDTVDPNLSVSTEFNIEVLPEEDFIRPGTRLRQLADARGLLFGYAVLQSYYERPDGALYADIAAEEFNIVSTENSIKFDFVNPLPGKFRWAATDNLVQQAKIDGQMIHGHTLVWHRQLPAWVKRSALEDREFIMREYIDRVLTRYGTDIPLWDVVNESLEDDGSFRNSVWYESMGASYIDIAFRQARQSAPEATLVYNEYDVSYAGPKADGMFALLQQLKDAGTPIDGVGFQMHLYSDFDKIDEVVANFQKAADLDLDIYITELDISIGDGQSLEQQAEVYEKVLSACLSQPRCKAFQTWGFTDQYSWRRGLRPLLFDTRYQAKPAYQTLQQRLSEN